MKVGRFIESNGPYLEALVEVEGRTLCVMDEFSVDAHSVPAQGDEFGIEFTVLLSEHEGWDEVFSGNPERKTGLEQIHGWEYMAFGEIKSLSPVLVDCGLIVVEDVVHTTDPGEVGEFVAFRITRLGAIAHEI